jgi:hypothetical protein
MISERLNVWAVAAFVMVWYSLLAIISVADNYLSLDITDSKCISDKKLSTIGKT